MALAKAQGPIYDFGPLTLQIALQNSGFFLSFEEKTRVLNF